MNAADNTQGALDPTSSERSAVLQALAYTGLGPASAQAAIIAGGVSVERLMATARLLPEPRPILLLDTLETLTILEQRAEAGEVPAALATRCTTVILSAPPSSAESPATYCLQTYLAVWEFLLANGLEPAKVGLCGSGHASEDERLQRSDEAATDLLLGHSSRFLAGVERSRLPPSKVIEWALFTARQGSPLHALALLHALHETVPRTTLAATIVELWASLGCPEPTLAWLDALEPQQRAQCEQPLRQAAQAREQVLRETLAENRAALLRLGVSVPDPISSASSVHVVLLPGVPWRPAAGGGTRHDRYLSLVRIEAGRFVDLSPPSHPRALFESLRKPRQRHEGAALVGSLRSPTLFQLISELPPLPQFPDWQRKVYVIEEDPAVAQAFLGTLALEPLLAEDRFELFLGPGATRRFEQRLLEAPLLPLPELVVDTNREQVEALVRVRDHRARRYLELVPKVAERYTRERLAELPRLLGPRPPRRLRVLIYTSFFTTVLKYQARDMHAAFASLGHEVRLLHETHATELMTKQAMLEAIEELDPDLFYCLDVIRPGLYGLPERLPVVCWMQDELPRLTRRQAIDELGPVDFTFCLAAEWTRRYRELGYPHTAQLSMAADTSLYAPQPTAAAAPGQRPVPAVVMITHVPRPVEVIPGLFAQLEPALRAEVKMRPRMSEYDPEIRAAAQVLGIELEGSRLDEARLSTHLLARHVELTQVARWLVAAGIEVGLYGKGWDELPDLKAHARGSLKPGRELAVVYGAAKVVLHINGTMNCHVRVFECLAAGGLPLCRSHATDHEPGELDDALRIGQEVLCFDGREDLLDKLNQLLTDDAYRLRIAAAGRNRVLTEHCMQHRMQRTLDEIRRALLVGNTPEPGPRRRSSDCTDPGRTAAPL